MAHPTRYVELAGDLDRFFGERLLSDDPQRNAALARGAEAGLPDHSVSPLQGELLYILARLMGARRVLEIGLLAGVSTLHFARAVGEGGEVVSLEIDPVSIATASQSLKDAGVGNRVRILEGAAQHSLDCLIEEGEPAFDFVFIDADKSSNVAYLQRVLKLVRPGSAILADNIVRNAAAVSGDPKDKRPARDVIAFFDALGASQGLRSTAVQTVGAKGYDGFTLSILKASALSEP